MLLNGTEARKKWPGLQIPQSSYIDDSVVILNPAKIKIGHHVRIDAFCVLSPNDGYIKIGNYVHIAVHCALFGSGGIEIGNFSNVAAYSILQSASDDFYNSMIGPTVPKEMTNVKKSLIKIEDHVILGMRTTVLPGVHISEGVATGAHTLLTKNADKMWKMYIGINKLYLPEQEYDRDFSGIREKASKLVNKPRLSGVLEPSDFAGNGFSSVYFDEPIERYEIELTPEKGGVKTHATVHGKDEYGFRVFSLVVGFPKHRWKWSVVLPRPR